MNMKSPLLYRWLTLLGYFSLMAGIYSWHLLIHKTEHELMSVIILLQMGPLLFPLRGLLHAKIYTHAWAMYLAIFYFIVGVWYASADESFLFGIFVVVTSLIFLTGTMFYTRFASKNQG
jgi:uncharacterized membrane protein